MQRRSETCCCILTQQTLETGVWCLSDWNGECRRTTLLGSIIQLFFSKILMLAEWSYSQLEKEAIAALVFIVYHGSEAICRTEGFPFHRPQISDKSFYPVNATPRSVASGIQTGVYSMVLTSTICNIFRRRMPTQMPSVICQFLKRYHVDTMVSLLSTCSKLDQSLNVVSW